MGFSERNEKTILIVDDEKAIRDVLSYNLRKEGYEILEAEDGVSAVEIATNKRPNIILLDVMIPQLDGLSVCKRIKSTYNVPILILSAKDSEIEKILGLEIGADDYITKPFSIREVIARIKANLRKNNPMIQEIMGEAKNDAKESIIHVKDIQLDVNRIEVKVSGKIIDLSLREFEVLKYLAENRGKLITREELLEAVWGYDHYGDKRTVDVTVRRIREKVEKINKRMQCIRTKRGIGYYIVEE